MGNSNLIDGVLRTNNCYKPRAYKITRITPHYMCWYTDARTCCESFVPAARRASANYCIGKDGEIWLNVDECNGAWTSGNYDNDNRAITIECANYMDSRDGHVYGELPKKTWDSLVQLCADICLRNGIASCTYTGNLNGVLTKHKWFQSTDCPGPWLDKQFGRLADEVNEIIGGGSIPFERVDKMTFLFTCGGKYSGNVYFYDGGTVHRVGTQAQQEACKHAFKTAVGANLPFFNLTDGEQFIDCVRNGI